MIDHMPLRGSREEPEPVSDVELGVAALLVVLMILAATLVVPLLT